MTYWGLLYVACEAIVFYLEQPTNNQFEAIYYLIPVHKKIVEQLFLSS